MPAPVTHALSIRQPWAWAILHAGKDIENRDWKPWNPGLSFRGPFLIHASKGMTRREYEDFISYVHELGRDHPFPAGLTVPAFDDLPRGGIVGYAEVAAAFRPGEYETASPWYMGGCGLILRNARELPFVPLSGMLGFFKLPADLAGGAE